MPVARHSVRLKAHDVVIGSAVLDCVLTGGLPVTPLMPCVASDHQLYDSRPAEGRLLKFEDSAMYLSASERRLTISAARASIATVGSQMGHCD